MLRIIAADDHRLILEALELVFAEVDDVELVATTHDARRILPLVTELAPDVVVVDVGMPYTDGWKSVELIRKRRPETAVVLFTGLRDPGAAERALAERVSLVTKGARPEDLVEAVRRAAAGEVVVDGGREPQIAANEHRLSPRELSILQSLASGNSNRAIARELSIAEQTVKFHLTNIYAKLDVPNRTRAARFAFENGLLHISPADEATASAAAAARAKVTAAAS
jgi:DNA-binding NarL/FixJ family response regulator